MPAVLVLLLPLLGGCASLEYYAQAARGHLALMSAARPLAPLIEDAGTAPRLRERLREAQALRAFASEELLLPDNDSYRSYADIGRRYVVWNVVATPALDLSPRQWCVPVAGCLSYRGYYAEADARALAAERRAAGDDVYVGGVRAYSTLGWFDDPVLNTMLEPPDPYLAGVLFHELAHQRLYVADDTDFNEAFATAVQEEGVRRWLLRRGDGEAQARQRLRMQHDADFVTLVEQYRVRLQTLYASAIDDAAKRQGKARLLDELRADYAALSAQGPQPPPYAAFLGAELNNARIAAVATYHALVPAFQRVLAECHGELPCFYARCAELAALAPAQRRASLAALGAPRRS